MAKERGEIPQFLKLRPKEIMYLPEERSRALNKEFQDVADEASKHMLNCLITTREEYQASLFQRTKAMRDAVEMIVKQHWLAEPNQSNSWDQTMPATTVTRSDEGERITMTIPFSTIFFRAIMAKVKTRTGIVAEKTYDKIGRAHV